MREARQNRGDPCEDDDDCASGTCKFPRMFEVRLSVPPYVDGGAALELGMEFTPVLPLILGLLSIPIP